MIFPASAKPPLPPIEEERAKTGLEGGLAASARGRGGEAKQRSALIVACATKIKGVAKLGSTEALLSPPTKFIVRLPNLLEPLPAPSRLVRVAPGDQSKVPLARLFQRAVLTQPEHLARRGSPPQLLRREFVPAAQVCECPAESREAKGRPRRGRQARSRSTLWRKEAAALPVFTYLCCSSNPSLCLSRPRLLSILTLQSSSASRPSLASLSPRLASSSRLAASTSPALPA